MSDELREILKRYFYPYNRQDAVLLNQTIKQIRSLQVQERKKWALGLLPKEEETLIVTPTDPEEIEAVAYTEGYNDVIAEIRKKIEEG